MIKQIKQMDNNCHIPDLVQAFSEPGMITLNLSLVRMSQQNPNVNLTPLFHLLSDGPLYYR